MHLSDSTLQRLLRSDEPDLPIAENDGRDPLGVALAHLEVCDACRQRLADLSGEQTWFADISGELLEVHHAAAQDDLVSGTASGLDQGRHPVAAANQQWSDATGDWDLPLGLAPDLPIGGGGSLSRITVSIGGATDIDGDADPRDGSAEAIRTDFLPPALHPELLGRLGRYDIEQTLGAGGFGIVFKAYDTELRRVVALKVLAPHLMSSGAARQRFAREAQAAAAIMHEHVIPIYDVVSQGEACYLVMQYIAGRSLQERVERDGALSVAEVLRIGSQIAAGLHAAHQQGLVHRDVKPANILLEETVDRVLISDFGLARTADDANLTRSGAITGTPHYMSPEQASGALVDPRSDLFSLGSVLYFACTGRPAFRAPQIVAVLNRICHFPHRRVTEINPAIPAPLADLIDRLLAKDPEDRFASALEVEQHLRHLLADWQSGHMAARLASDGFAPRPTAGDAGGRAAVAHQQVLRRGRWGWPVAVTLMAACLGAWLLLSPAIRDWSQRALNANRPSLPDTTGGLGSGDALFVGDALVGGHALVGGGDLADPPQPGNTAGANLVEQPSADGTAAERSTGSIASSTSDPSAGPPSGPGRASARVQFELLQLHWDSDSQPLLWQMEAVHQTWLQEDQALDLWLKLLKDLPPQAAEKE